MRRSGAGGSESHPLINDQLSNPLQWEHWFLGAGGGRCLMIKRTESCVISVLG